MNTTTLYEQYRPRTWDDLIGQPKVRKIVDCLRKRGLAGRAYFISGPTGTGKTSAAYLIAREVADDLAIEEIDGTQVTAGWLEDLERRWHLIPLGAGDKIGRAFVINEAHGLSAYAVKRLLVLLEGATLPRHCTVIFTTTFDGLALFEDQRLDASPLLHRCTELRLTSQGLSRPFAERAKAIAEAEGLDGQPIEKYMRLAQDCKNSMRAMLDKVEEGAMAGEVVPT